MQKVIWIFKIEAAAQWEPLKIAPAEISAETSLDTGRYLKIFSQLATQCPAISHLAPEIHSGYRRSGNVACFLWRCSWWHLISTYKNQLVLSITKYFLRKLIQGSATAFEYSRNANLTAIKGGGLGGLISQTLGHLSSVSKWLLILEIISLFRA